MVADTGSFGPAAESARVSTFPARWSGALALLAVLALQGCQTQLQARHDGDGRYVTRTNAARDIPLGVDYAVPMLQFQIQAIRRIVECTNADGSGRVRFVFKVTAEPHYVPGERFVIDYEKLSGWSKTSKVEVQTYDNGTIKSINAAAEDKTASIIGDVVKSVVRVASLAQGVPLPSAETKEKSVLSLEDRYVCSENTRTALTLLKQAEGDLKKATEKLVALTDEAASLERLARIDGLDTAGRRRLVALQPILKQQVKSVADMSDDLATLEKRVSLEETITWPLDPLERDLSLAPSPRNQKKLEEEMFKKLEKAQGGNTLAELGVATRLKGSLVPTVVAKEVSCPQGGSSRCARREETDSDKSEGLLYRNPAPARLLICDGSQDDQCSVRAASGVVMTAQAMAPQLGELRLLPYRNGVFQNNELKATFRENGAVATFNYDDKTARGKELSGAVLAGLDEVVAYRDAREAAKEKKASDAKAEEAARKQAELDKLDHEIARLEKLKKISDLNAQSAQGASTTEVESETARINAQIALLEAKKKLQDAEAALGK